MSNKTGVIVLTLILTLLSAYYLHFTFVARSIDANITEQAKDKKTGNVDFAKRQALFDSLWTEKVWLGYTYRQIKEQELALGLDLQGGMQVTLEISPVEIIKVMAGNSTDANLKTSLEQARDKQANSSRNFVDLFYESYKALPNSKPLNQLFVNSVTRSMFKADASDNEIVNAIKHELDGAIDRSYDILKARIDKFGVANPEIKRLAGTNRISIELPGVDNPARARKLISGTARLEFWEVAEMNDPAVQTSFGQFSDYLAKLEAKEKGKGKEGKAEDGKKTGSDLGADVDTTNKDKKVEEKEGKKEADSLNKKKPEDTTKSKNDTAKKPQQAKVDTTKKPSKYANLFGMSQNGLNALVRDTAKINRFIRDSKAFPNNLNLLWEAKADEGQRVTLYFLKKSAGNKPALEGEVVNNAYVDYEQGSANASVGMSMNTVGARKWRKLTKESIGKRIAIVMDNAVYSAPVVQNEIPNGNSSITGNFTVEEATDLANILKSGKMPAPTRIVEEAVVGASLGAESVQQGIISIICGILVVFAFMTIYYSLAGTFANIAMLINLFFTMGSLAQFGSVLTLSGIAGLVLSVGMSVDANVLIYERIREEVRQGLGLREAVRIGFVKALSSIIDSNATTFLVGLILFTFGTGAVLGFATTLMIGIVASLLTSVFVTRLIVEWWIGKDKRNLTFNSVFFNNSFGRTNFDFVGVRKKAYLFSTVIIVAGLALAIAQGGFTLGVDFKGGRSYIVSFAETIPVAEVRNQVSGEFKSGVEVKTYGRSNQVKITTTYKVADGSEKADQEVRGKLENALKKFEGKKPKIESSSKVESTIATDILYKSNVAVILSLIAMAIYILARFLNWRYSLAAMISLFHNVVIVLAFIGIMQAVGIVFEIDQVLIAALLTVVGYSINDTVVVFDRIREFSGDINRADFGKQLNLAINDTLSRTIVTGTTTILNVVILLAFAGASLSGFSFSLLIGIVFGTYSSIFVASPIVLDLVGRKNENAPKSEVDLVK
jgi:SecD/SecF fusion protein